MVYALFFMDVISHSKEKFTEKENVLMYHINSLKVESHIISIDT